MANLMNEFLDIETEQGEPLTNYAHTKTGGPADWLVFPETIDQAKKLVDYIREYKMGLVVLENASNLIVGDGGIDDLTITFTQLNKTEVHDSKVTAQIGASYIATTEAARDSKLTRLKLVVGISGSIGRTILMNASTYDGETKNVVSEVTVTLPDGTVKHFINEELDFGYQYSSIQNNNGVMLDVTFASEPGKYDDIEIRIDDLNERWEAKQSLDLPSCGSIFRRPEGYYTGKSIHDTGLQGYTSGGTQASTKYAGFIANIDHGTAVNYVSVIHHVRGTVKEKFGVDLETEMRIIGRQD